jgi:hypothetical protein
MLAKCIIGHDGVLDQGAFYTICDITKNGNIKLYEVDPPEPFTSFNKDRFKLYTEEEVFGPFEFEDENIPEELRLV